MKQIENVILIGRGAVGTVMGSILQEYLQDRFAFVVDEERKARYENHPLMVNGQYPAYQYITSPQDSRSKGEDGKGEPFGKADLILIATKYGALPRAMELAEPFIQADTIIMPCINGLKSEEDLRHRFEEAITLRTIAQKMDANYHDNQVEYTQKGELVFGVDDTRDPASPNLPSRQEQAAQQVLQLFEAAGLPCVLSEDIVYDQWNKLMLNCGINQVCAAYHATYGQVVTDPELRNIFISAMDEVARTARAMNMEIGQKQIDQWIEAVENLAPDSMPSMQQDVLAGRPTEEELFSAYVLPLAQKHHVAAPTLAMLKEKVDALDAALLQAA